MKKPLTTIFLIIILFLTVLNSIFLIELYKNNDLKEFYYNNQALPDNYSEKEIIHMQEVKDLVNLFIVLDLIFIIALLSLKQKPELKKTGISLIIISALLFIGAIFYQSFHHNIHLLLFKSDTWLLPASSTLIQTYPLEYFQNKFVTINLIYLILGIILISKSLNRKQELKK